MAGGVMSRLTRSAGALFSVGFLPVVGCIALPAVAQQGGEAVPFQVPSGVLAGEPRGPYPTATFEALWVNEVLDDPSTSDPHDKRKVVVQVWYPAAPHQRARLAPYVISPQLYPSDHWVHELAHVETRSALDAPMAAQPARFPVLIYNHGNASPHFSATFQTEFLASHGYVVVSIGHPGANGIERFPDGTTYQNDGVKWLAEVPEGDGAGQLDPDQKAEYVLANSDLSLFVQDIGFVLDRLAALDADPRHRFHQRLDLERVGSLGWSLGGIVSLQAARDEPRIKAAVNMDGGPFGLMGPNGAVTRGSERPVLLMFAKTDEGAASREYSDQEVDAAEIDMNRKAVTYRWTLLRRSTADWYHVTIARIHHGHFSDQSLFAAAEPPALHPRAAHAIINEHALEFFDKHVRGVQAPKPLLSGKKIYPEATLLRRKRCGSDEA